MKIITLESLLVDNNINKDEDISFEDIDIESVNIQMEIADIECEINTLESALIVEMESGAGDKIRRILKAIKDFFVNLGRKILNFFKWVWEKFSISKKTKRPSKEDVEKKLREENEALEKARKIAEEKERIERVNKEMESFKDDLKFWMDIGEEMGKRQAEEIMEKAKERTQNRKQEFSKLHNRNPQDLFAHSESDVIDVVAEIVSNPTEFEKDMKKTEKNLNELDKDAIEVIDKLDKIRPTTVDEESLKNELTKEFAQISQDYDKCVTECMKSTLGCIKEVDELTKHCLDVDEKIAEKSNVIDEKMKKLNKRLDQ